MAGPRSWPRSRPARPNGAGEAYATVAALSCPVSCPPLDGTMANSSDSSITIVAHPRSRRRGGVGRGRLEQGRGLQALWRDFWRARAAIGRAAACAVAERRNTDASGGIAYVSGMVELPNQAHPRSKKNEELNLRRPRSPQRGKGRLSTFLRGID